MLKHESFECEVCGKVYDTQEKAEKCETWHHTCPCKRERYVHFSRLMMGYGRVANGYIDFQNRKIGVCYPTDVDQHESVESEFELKFCPFCGEPLLKKK